MTQSDDHRIPVELGSIDAAGPDAALLVEGDLPVPEGHAVARFRPAPGFPAHAIGCACCTPRGPVSDALGRLFLARARGEVPFFRSVTAVATSPAGQAAILAALTTDQVSAGRFRLAER